MRLPRIISQSLGMIFYCVQHQRHNCIAESTGQADSAREIFDSSSNFLKPKCLFPASDLQSTGREKSDVESKCVKLGYKKKLI